MGSSKPSEFESSRSPVRIRPRVFIVLALMVALGVASHYVWRHYAPSVAQHDQYRVTAEDIHITPPPPWIRSDIKTEVLRDAGLSGTLSVLDDWEPLAGRVRGAFEMHPWVDSVVRITRRLPSALEVELKYRRPVAAVESIESSGVNFIPVDANAIRLPDADLTDVERHYLPRISGVTGRPLVGDAWEDQRVVGGAKLAAALADIWQKLRLVEIVSLPQPQIRNDVKIFSFEIITSGGTRIVWGAAPGREQDAAESPFDAKRKRLLEYAASHGQLDSIDGPASVDVRSDKLVVHPRTARRPGAKPPK